MEGFCFFLISVTGLSKHNIGKDDDDYYDSVVKCTYRGYMNLLCYKLN